ncbi:GTP-binding protein [Balneicella halophila]|uniref:Probable GTP-binding protein EngB n=1 Tax=Balneicella halophila TaxID=1537566 RepID=A0A7L4USN5_BALHA|nr:ribosome biogenesis GTP-binding protein YihA/YsxC [Balneicella halophila]PVX52247.1 GTP-binding protein [Balneicella halophila]
MNIKSAEFLMSNSKVHLCPEPNLPEFAFIGRSNVGKSSLINMLTERKSLAKTSSTPGKTQLINHFIINDEWYLVDLPGYGYAKMPEKPRKKLKAIIENYILGRENLTNIFVLIDSRHSPQQIDLEFMEWLGESQIPFSIIFTKTDKLSKGALLKNIETYRQEMLKVWEDMPPYFTSSSTKREGRDEILDYLDTILKQI